MQKSALGRVWVISKKSKKDIIETLLENRGLTSKKDRHEFLNPTNPTDIKLSEVGISAVDIKKAIKRITRAIKSKEKIIIYGDYDADGICSSAILWETLYAQKADVLPYLPERFKEGYGLNPESVVALKEKYSNLGLLITVDNGITANGGVDKANDLGIDVIVADHHQKSKKLPKAYSIIHTTQICGAGIAWFFAREIKKYFKSHNINSGLELVAIGTVADQMPLLGVNRSLVKYGLNLLNKTNRVGLLYLFKDSGIKKGEINTYTIGFVVAPRLNAMGRLGHAIDSLRLICTKNVTKAGELSKILNKTNRERQRVVEEVIVHAREFVSANNDDGIIVVADVSYHEGVIGLAASKLVEEFWRPAIVFSKGAEISKASARSIPGINILEVIQSSQITLLTGGGHEMAAGFSIETDMLTNFTNSIKKLSKKYVTKKVLDKPLKIDSKIEFDQINRKLCSELKKFEPAGMGNPAPTFTSEKVNFVETKLVGADSKHIKAKLKQGNKVINAICFGMGEFYRELRPENPVDIVYTVEENVWNGNSELQLKIRDFKL